MSTYTQILYQIVFTTKNRENSLIKEGREELFKYIWGALKQKKCHLYRINGVEDHIHIATHIPPSIAPSDLIRDIKTTSSIWIKEENIFPEFDNWQIGYGAFTYSIKEKDYLINYIKNQENHHRKTSFIDEYRKLLLEFEVDFDEKYLL